MTNISKIFAAAVFLMATACSSDAPTAVFDPNARATLALDASVRLQTTAGASLRVVTSYRRTNQSLVPLDSQAIALSEATSQQVPISIDLAPCLRDAQRAGANGAAPAADECLVTLQLSLVTSGTVVDQETLSNLVMAPGRTTQVSTPITLEEVGTVRLTPPSANVVSPGAPLRLESTRSMTVAAEVVDGAGRTITRPVTWSSASATIASVTQAGVVTGASPGTVRITASVGGRSAFVDVRVVPLPQTVTVVAGTGSSGTGTVTSTPAGISCTITGTTTSGTCSAPFPGDATVSFAVTPGSNTSFGGWGGDCTGTGACIVASSQPRTVSVNLQSFRTLTVSATGSGNGIITATGGVINCVWRFGSASSGPCTAQVPDGAQISVVANPEAGSQFIGWNSECTVVNSNICTLTMNANKSPVVTFRGTTTYRITAGLGNGTGTVTSNPSGMNCTVNGTAVSGTCSITVIAGTVVQLIPTGTSGSGIRGWDGACVNATTTCTLTAPQAPSDVPLRVNFERLAQLRVNIDPLSTGTGQLNGTNFFYCQITGTTASVPCQQSYPVGTSVTVQANRIGYTDFVSWGGACANFVNNSCTLTLNSDQVASVRFENVPSVRLTTNLEGFSYNLQVTHPYQQEQRCERNAPLGFNSPTTVCQITVPVQRFFTTQFGVPPTGWYYYYDDGLCADQIESTIPCSRRVSRDTSTVTWAFPDEYAASPPTGGKTTLKTTLKRKGGAR